MREPILSIGIPFYSGQDYLRRAVESVLCQSFPDWELVVCDDAGPGANVESLVRSYGDARVRYYRNERTLGMVGNWNRCLNLARAGLVTLLHADDEMLPHYGELMVSAAAHHERAAALFCGARIINAQGAKSFSFRDAFKALLAPVGGRPRVVAGETGLMAILRGNFILCPTLCYRRERIQGRRFSPQWKFAQDMDFIARLLLEGEEIVQLPEVAYAYRRHDANATAQYTETLYRFEEERRLYAMIRERALQRGWRRAARIAAGGWIIKLHLGYCALQDLVQLRPRPSARKMALLLKMLCGASVPAN
jgi:glycosyltransferase involved in cell wall biosynthesis